MNFENLPFITNAETFSDYPILRKKNLESYKKQGLPLLKEEWRYTKLNSLLTVDFKPSSEVYLDYIPEFKAQSIDAYNFVLVNGKFRKDLSFNGEIPAGVTACLLSELNENPPEWLNEQFGVTAKTEDAPFAALNSANFSDCFVLRLADDVVLDKPVHIISIGMSSNESVVFYPRILIRIGFGSSATVIESHTGIDGEPYFSNIVTELHVREGGRLRHYKHQDEQKNSFHIALTQGIIETRAVYENFVLQTGAVLGRNELHVQLDGEYAEVKANGAYFADGKRHIDYTVLVDHAVADTKSSQICKGVADDDSRALFQSKILVRKDSQRIEGDQLHKALLLSSNAEIDCKPALEVYADDVKCSHGATVGELDEDQMFYLRTRGFDEKSARNLLIEAFLDDVIHEISDVSVRKVFLDITSTK